MVGQAISGLKYFNLYLKWDGWSVVDINILPTGGDALSVVAALFFGILADQTGWNATLVVLLQGIVITSNSMLAAWCSGHDLSKGSLLFAYYLSYVGLAAQPIVIVSTYNVPPVPVTRLVIISSPLSSPKRTKKNSNQASHVCFLFKIFPSQKLIFSLFIIVLGQPSRSQRSHSPPNARGVRECSFIYMECVAPTRCISNI